MFKKIFSILALIIAATLFSTNANALQLNIKLGNDVLTNQDKLNIYYDIYYPESSVSQQINGMSQDVFKLWLNAFNQENKDLVPIDSQGKHSQISLGYRNNSGKDIFPSSCQNLNLTAVKILNIELNEGGCIVH